MRVSLLVLVYLFTLQALDLALENLPKVFAASPDAAEAEGVLNVICWLFQRILENSSPANAVALVDKLVSKLTSDPKQHPIVRLKMCDSPSLLIS